MPIGLTNVLASFQRMINKVLKEYIDNFIIAYLDNLLIYLETLKEYKQYIYTIL